MWSASFVLSFLLFVLLMVADLEAFTQKSLLLIPSQVLFQKKNNKIEKSRFQTAIFSQQPAPSTPPTTKEKASTPSAAESTAFMPPRNGVRNKKKHTKKKRKPKSKQGHQELVTSFYPNNTTYQNVDKSFSIAIASQILTIEKELIKTRRSSVSSTVLNSDNDKDEQLLELDDQNEAISTQEPSSALLQEHVTPPTPLLLLQGDLPDIFWRAIPMDHVRQHPYFVPLLPTHKVQILQKSGNIDDQLKLEEAARQYRQGSWQWDTLHLGRCTTSCAAAALGFLENIAGEVLGVHSSWRRPDAARKAFVRMRHPPAIRTMQDLKRIFLCTNAESDDEEDDDELEKNINCRENDLGRWKKLEQGTNTFAALYNGSSPTKQELQQRKALARRLTQNDQVTKSLRMSWGNTQEATSLLTALNHFVKQEGPEFRLHEVGMCGAGLDLNHTGASSSLLIGASPDGVLVFPDGRIEALEVKNHCPFMTRFVKKGRRRTGKRFFIRDQPFDETVFPHYVSQLQLEMYCLGGHCQAAVMVRQTATRGALFLRMQRDEAWIHEMLHFLHRFQREFVETNIPPPPNFFWLDENRKEQSRCRDFVNRTMELRKSVKVVATLSAEEIQRADETSPLFLDEK